MTETAVEAEKRRGGGGGGEEVAGRVQDFVFLQADAVSAFGYLAAFGVAADSAFDVGVC